MSRCIGLQKILDGPLEHALTHPNGSDLELTLTNAACQADYTFCLAGVALMAKEIGLVPC